MDTLVPISKRRGYLHIFISAALLITWISSSLIIQHVREKEISQQNTIRVVAVQPGTTEVAFSNPDMDQQSRLSLLTDITKQTESFAAHLIVWPELVLNFDPEIRFVEQFKDLAADMDAYLVLPYGLLEDGHMRNEVKVLSPAGVFHPLYSKTHPVSFAGEQRGPNWGAFPVHSTSFGQLGTIICYDLNYTDVTRIMAKNGAQIIAVPSNDWPGIVEKQNIHLVFRAIENNMSLVKSESAYDSVVISPLGEIIAETVSYEPMQDSIVTEVKLGTAEPTIYSIVGDIVGWIMFALGFAFMWMEGYVNKKPKKRKE